VWLPQFFLVDTNSPCKDLLFPRGPTLAQKPLNLVCTVLKSYYVARKVDCATNYAISFQLVSAVQEAIIVWRKDENSWNKPFVASFLRNRKHVPCFYRVIQTHVEVWEKEKCCGNMSRRLRVLPNFHECLYNSIETRSTCFLFLLENTATRKRKTTC